MECEIAEMFAHSWDSALGDTTSDQVFTIHSPVFTLNGPFPLNFTEDANFLCILLQNVKGFYSNKCNMVMIWCVVERTKTEAEGWFSCCRP